MESTHGFLQTYLYINSHLVCRVRGFSTVRVRKEKLTYLSYKEERLISTAQDFSIPLKLSVSFN